MMELKIGERKEIHVRINAESMKETQDLKRNNSRNEDRTEVYIMRECINIVGRIE